MAADRITFNNKIRLIERDEPNENLGKADDFNEIKTVVNNHANDLDTISAEQSSQGSRITTNEGDITIIEAEQVVQNTDISNLETEQGVQRTDITNLQNEQSAQGGRITQNETDISTNESNISTNASAITANTNLANTKEPLITVGISSQYWNGLKSFVDFATSVRDSVLTGLSISNVVITAADTVLSALGKLQGQINSIVSRVTQNENDIATKQNIIPTGDPESYFNGELDLVNFNLSAVNSILTGIVFSDTDIVATDSLIQAIGKAQGQLNVIKDDVLSNTDNKLSKSGGTMTGAILGNQQIDGYRGTDQLLVTADALITALTVNKLTRVDSSSSNINITLESNASPIGTEWDLYCTSYTGTINFLVDGVSLLGKTSITGLGDWVTVKKVASTTYLIR